MRFVSANLTFTNFESPGIYSIGLTKALKGLLLVSLISALAACSGKSRKKSTELKETTFTEESKDGPAKTGAEKEPRSTGANATPIADTTPTAEQAPKANIQADTSAISSEDGSSPQNPPRIPSVNVPTKVDLSEPGAALASWNTPATVGNLPPPISSTDADRKADDKIPSGGAPLPANAKPTVQNNSKSPKILIQGRGLYGFQKEKVVALNAYPTKTSLCRWVFIPHSKAQEVDTKAQSLNLQVSLDNGQSWKNLYTHETRNGTSISEKIQESKTFSIDSVSNASPEDNLQTKLSFATWTQGSISRFAGQMAASIEASPLTVYMESYKTDLNTDLGEFKKALKSDGAEPTKEGYGVFVRNSMGEFTKDKLEVFYRKAESGEIKLSSIRLYSSTANLDKMNSTTQSYPYKKDSLRMIGNEASLKAQELICYSELLWNQQK